MQAGFTSSLLGSHVRLRNGTEGAAVAVGQSHQGFGLVFTLLLADGTLQDAHSSEVAALTLAAPPKGVPHFGGVQAEFAPEQKPDPARKR